MRREKKEKRVEMENKKGNGIKSSSSSTIQSNPNQPRHEGVETTRERKEEKKCQQSHIYARPTPAGPVEYNTERAVLYCRMRKPMPMPKSTTHLTQIHTIHLYITVGIRRRFPPTLQQTRRAIIPRLRNRRSNRRSGRHVVMRTIFMRRILMRRSNI